MPQLSKLVFFVGFSSSRGLASGIRVAESTRRLTSRQWINEYCPGGILDLGAEGERWEKFRSELHLDETDWDSSDRYFHAFTARELHYHVRTELELQAGIAKAMSLVDEANYHGIEEVLEAHGGNWDILLWIESQTSRLVTTSLYYLLSSYSVITSSKPVHKFNEFLLNPIHGELTAIKFAARLNKAFSDETGDSSVAFFAVRIGDLPSTLNADDDQLDLIDWLSDKLLIPRGYTTMEKCRVLSSNDSAANTWIARAKNLLE